MAHLIDFKYVHDKLIPGALDTPYQVWKLRFYKTSFCITNVQSTRKKKDYLVQKRLRVHAINR